MTAARPARPARTKLDDRGAGGYGTGMTAAISPRLLQLLELERGALLAAVHAVPSHLRERRPAPGRWSVAEVLDHLARVEEGVTKLLAARGTVAPAEPPDDAAVAAAQLSVERIAGLRNRERLCEAPERVRPAPETDFASALARVQAARQALLAVLGGCNAAALAEVTYVHPAIGRLTLTGWVESVAHHEARHTGQIIEIAGQVQAGASTPA